MGSEFLNENDVDTNSLVKILESAYIEIDNIDEDKVSVFLDIFTIHISLNKEKKSINFLSLFELPENINIVMASEKINLFNCLLDFGIFCLELEDNTTYIVGKYAFSYKKGLIPFQFIDYLRVFDKKFTEGARAIHKNAEETIWKK